MFCNNPINHRIKIEFDTKDLFPFTDDRERNILVCQACLKELEALPKVEKIKLNFEVDVIRMMSARDKRHASDLRENIRLILINSPGLSIIEISDEISVYPDRTRKVINSMKNEVIKKKCSGKRAGYFKFFLNEVKEA